MMFGEAICQETISATTFMFNFSPGSFVYFYGTIFRGVKANLKVLFKGGGWGGERGKKASVKRSRYRGARDCFYDGAADGRAL